MQLFFDGKVYFGIEVNYSRSKTSKRKSLTYGHQLTLRQLTNSESYKELKPITIININARDTTYKIGEFVYETVLMEKQHHLEYTELLKIYDINLSYYKKIDYNSINEGLLKDLALFVIEDEKVLKTIYKGDRMIQMVKKNLENFTQLFDEAFYCSEEELQRQIDEEMKEEGFKEGFLDGAKKNSMDIAKKMKSLGTNTIEQIATITGLSIEEISKLTTE